MLTYKTANILTRMMFLQLWKNCCCIITEIKGFQCGEDPAAENMLLFLYEQQKLGLPYRSELMESTAASLITYILQRYMDTMQPLYRIALRDQRILDMVNYMYNHFRTVTLHDLAAEFHYNESYLSRMFQEQAGRSFSETIKDF